MLWLLCGDSRWTVSTGGLDRFCEPVRGLNARVVAGTEQDAALPRAEKGTEVKALECHSMFVCTGIT